MEIRLINCDFIEENWLASNNITDDLRKILNDSIDRSMRRGIFGRVHPSIMLWALLRWEKSLGVLMLEACGVDPTSLEQDLALLMMASQPTIAHELIIDCSTLEEIAIAACEEARSLGREHVGTEHLVLALLHINDEHINKIFENSNVNYDIYLKTLGEMGSGTDL